MAATVESTVTWDTLASMSLANYQPVFHDNVFKANVLLFWLQGVGKAKRTEDGGTRIEETLMYGKNEAFQNYDGYDVLDPTPQEGFTKAFFDWKNGSIPITVSRTERRKNSGKGRLINLLKGKMDQAELSFNEQMNKQLIGDYTSATTENYGIASETKRFTGVSAYVQKAPTGSYTVGGIAQASETWWQNQALDYGEAYGAWADDGIRAIRRMYRLCSLGPSHPDLLLMDPETYEEYEDIAEGKQQYLDTRFADAGFINLRYKGALMTYDDWFTEMSTAQKFTSNTGIILFLNSMHLDWVVDSETDFITTEFRTPTVQMASVAWLLVMGQLVCNNRRRLGILFDIGSTGTTS